MLCVGILLRSLHGLRSSVAMPPPPLSNALLAPCEVIKGHKSN